MTIELSKRKFFVGLGATLITAPAIVRAASLMPVKALEKEIGFDALMTGRPGAYWATPMDVYNVVMKARQAGTFEIQHAIREYMIESGQQLWA